VDTGLQLVPSGEYRGLAKGPGDHVGTGLLTNGPQIALPFWTARSGCSIYQETTCDCRDRPLRDALMPSAVYSPVPRLTPAGYFPTSRSARGVVHFPGEDTAQAQRPASISAPHSGRHAVTSPGRDQNNPGRTIAIQASNVSRFMT